ncbi:hypothetical protein BCR34DRAFT_597698 [Clohesyomyces aquaticus]|uniref:Rhodopsin domain-containing protein n=1 Tax=Clohesyomyces aquaticus TaxID=1231657 RepID=A0A1Y2A1K1_9PLEO|nr:hypothetical protein BCR34DRAFT_597698 [Clohesyomyces aquaticus]
MAGAYLYITCLVAAKLSINLLHIRVTERFPRLNAWAIRSVYFIIFSWIFNLFAASFSCFPFSRRWNGMVGIEKPCNPIVRSWDFWAHIALHVITDIWLCILPFPALAQLRTKPKLRVAIFCVYGLAFCSVIATIIRAVLLGISPRDNAHAIFILSTIETSILITVAALPPVSSAFTHRFMTESTGSYMLGRVKMTDTSHRKTLSQLHDDGADKIKPNVSTQSASTSTQEMNRDCDESELVARLDGKTQVIF